jgi:hypothetical protein
MGLFGTPLCQAQVSSSPDSSEWRPYQIGFSTAAFLRIFESADAPAQYQIYGRYRATRRWTLRSALRYEHQIEEEDQEVQLGMRLGVDRVFYDAGHLQLYSGVDLVGRYEQFLNGERTYRGGIGPLLGILISITPSVSLSVEPRIVGTYVYEKSADGAVESSSDEGRYAVQLRGDGLLILSVHF